MKSYYYGEPNIALSRLLTRAAKRYPVLVWPVALVFLAIRVFILLPAWVLVKIGNLGHHIAYAVGYDSRGW